ncbi:MAG: transcription elongation factor GreA [Oscillospiraceae bacterium]|jgi:transcription elongation factor GreA|nr:transcription elongation factor GreA [Oscillospiraceae bacterium]
MAKYKLTQKAYDEISEELRRLQTTEMDAVTKRLKEARSFGDLSENSEYDEAKNDQGKLNSRITELVDIRDNTEIIPENMVSERVVPGITVTVLNKATKKEKTYKVVGTREADPRVGLISEESPIGAALLGKEIGEEVVVETPTGTLKFKLLRFETVK